MEAAAKEAERIGQTEEALDFRNLARSRRMRLNEYRQSRESSRNDGFSRDPENP